MSIFADLRELKECETCGNQAIAACDSCGKHVCVEHGAKKVEENEEVAFYCNEHL